MLRLGISNSETYTKRTDYKDNEKLDLAELEKSTGCKAIKYNKCAGRGPAQRLIFGNKEYYDWDNDGKVDTSFEIIVLSFGMDKKLYDRIQESKARKSKSKI